MASAVTAVIILLSISKLLDILSTLARIRSVNSESNPLARNLMKRFGIKRTAWLIFMISLAIIMLTGITAISSNRFVQIGFILIGTIISIIQFSVAISNWSGKHNLVTRNFLKFHQFISQLIARKNHY